MPSPHIKKPYRENAFYHVYNRGTFMNDIFFDPSDYHVFRKMVRNTLRQLLGEIEIHAFALMPNHFHFLLYQRNSRAISRFMQSLGIKYSLYLRRMYGKSGRLFEGPYRAVLLSTRKDVERIHLYIADNPITSDLHEWPHVGTKI